MYLIWIFWVQIDSIEWPIKSNSVGSGNMSPCGPISFDNHLNHCFVVLRHATKLLDAKIGRLREHNQYYSTRWSFLEIVCLVLDLCHRSQRVAPFCLKSESRFQGQKIRSHKWRAGIPSNLNPASKEISDSVDLCVKLKFVSYTSNCLAQTSDFRRTHNVPPEVRFWVLKISSKIGVLKQSQPALFGSITHITILFVFTCVMDVRYQSIQSLVTSFGPWRECGNWLWRFSLKMSCSIFLMHKLWITKKMRYSLRYLIIGEKIFPWFNISPSPPPNRNYSWWRAGKFSSLWFCLGLWWACKIFRIQF